MKRAAPQVERFGNNERDALGCHTTGVEIGVEGSQFALCEVSHNDLPAAKHGGRRPGGWHALAVRTHWPPGRKEDGMAGR